jgi:hypothetical protein
MIRVPAEYGGGGGEEEPGPHHPRLQAGQPCRQPGQGEHFVRCIPARLVPGIPCNLTGHTVLPGQVFGPSNCNSIFFVS